MHLTGSSNAPLDYTLCPVQEHLRTYQDHVVNFDIPVVADKPEWGI